MAIAEIKSWYIAWISKKNSVARRINYNSLIISYSRFLQILDEFY